MISSTSIRRRLTMHFILLAVVPLLAVAGVVAKHAFTEQKRQAMIVQREVAQQVAFRTQEFIHGLVDRLNLANQLNNLTTMDEAQRNRVLLSLLQFGRKPFETLALLDKNGRELIRISRYAGLSFASLEDRYNQDEFKRPMATVNPYYGPVRFNPVTGEPLMTIAAPLIDLKQGEPNGVLVAEARLKHFWDLIARMRLGKGENVFIVDSNGRVVAHRNPSVVLSGTVFPHTDKEGITRGLSNNLAVLASNQMKLGEETFTVIAERNLSEALGLGFSAMTSILFLTAVFLCVAAAMAFITVPRIVRPIFNLAKTASEVKNGDLSRRARIESDDEIGELAEAFNSMTAQLEQTMQGLTDKVDELTTIQERLKDSESRYRALYEKATEGILLTDEKAMIRDANPQARNLLGHSLEELSDMNWEDLIHPEDIAIAPIDEILGQILGGKTFRIERRFRRKDGGHIVAGVEATAISENLIQIMFRDMTDRIRMEKEMMRAKNMAEQANKAKSEFLANMSHEIRTPLGCVIGMTELTLDSELDAEDRENLETVLDSALSLMEIINDILDFTRIEAQQLHLSPVDFDIRRELAKTMRTFSSQAARKDNQIELKVAPDVPELVKGDPGRLAQIIRNLVGNALKFTENGSVFLGVENHTGRSGRPTLLFTVADTGIGIPEDKLNLLFKSFSQVDCSFSKKHSGTGLGLAISKKLTEMMGGRIWVESAKGEGSIFYFTAVLDQADKPTEHPLEAEPVKTDLSEMIEASPKLSILYAEDNQANQVFISKFLTGAGHKVKTASNGLQALDLLEKERFDLVLMDIQMPEMDGLEATKIIRESSSDRFDPAVPIIALTAYAMKEDKEKFLQAGMDGYVSKPVNKMALLKTMISVMSARDENAIDQT